ncbi:hypothetical protein NLI96_g4409 [Meripilus lineatus]|uniref:Uncharacterized protein n=1 Tax=Meripilus lineatus TaxID=2056292 RepID=A0AAD5V4X3_9APHY|nr:hypothetical protein NLI96_g4409 [Physisporinus lineatus]
MVHSRSQSKTTLARANLHKKVTGVYGTLQQPRVPLYFRFGSYLEAPRVSMDPPPLDEPHVQHVPLLRRSSRLRPQRLKPHRAPRRTALLLTLGVFHVACNVGILYATFHTYRFGSRIGKDSWWITDNLMLSVIEPCGTILYTITALLGGWAMSHLWSRRLSNRSAGGLAELQSFQIYQSIPTILSSITHFFSGHYILAQWLYAAVITSAILFQFYTTAIVTLITPSITVVDHPAKSYYFLEGSFMSSSGYGRRCPSSRTTADVVRACLEITLSGTALIDAEHFDGSIPWTLDASPLWVEVDTSYTSPGRFVSAAIPLGPVNNHNFSDGAMLYGINMATVDRMSSEASNVWNSFAFEVIVTTRLPALISQCARQDPGNTTVSNINIHGTSYTLPTPVPSLKQGEIVGQVTPDNMTLVISIPSSQPPTSNIHCVVNLGLQDALLTIIGSDSAGIPVTANGVLLVYPSGEPWRDQQASTSNQEPVPHSIREFAEVWLSGLGWSSAPTSGSTALVDFLGAMPVGTGGLEPVSGSQSLESYILVMLSNGIGAAFPPEDLPASKEELESATERVYWFYKSEYFLGITSKWHYIHVGIIALDSVFVIFCMFTILTFGWFPDFTDPVTFARAAVYSGSGLSSTQSDQSGAEKPVFPPKSPVPLVNGEDEDEKLWKECFTLKEVIDGNRRVLVFEPAALAETEDLD